MWVLKSTGFDDVSDHGMQNEKGSILSGAYEYIEKLQRQVQELSSELDTDSSCSDDDDMSSCEFLTDDDEERPVDSKAALVANHGECRGCSHPTVGFCRATLFCFCLHHGKCTAHPPWLQP